MTSAEIYNTGRDSPAGRPATTGRRSRHPAWQSLPQTAPSSNIRRLRRALLNHRGRAVVFHGVDDLRARIDDPDLDVNENDVLVLQNSGPVGGPGMPEVGNLPYPQEAAAAGVRDMVRISDARMSGTAFGTIVLHVAPESAVGGPLALVRDGDEIELDFDNRSLTLHVDDAELDRRRQDWQAPPPAFTARVRTALPATRHPSPARSRLRLPAGQRSRDDHRPAQVLMCS